MSNDNESNTQELVIIRRHRGGEEGGHHGGVWKIAYADFMTAMMAFFLVMWLINSADKQTLTQVASYFNPLRLTDKVPTTKGLHQSETGAQGSRDEQSGDKEANSGKEQNAKSKSEKKEKAEHDGQGTKPLYAEEALFQDPIGLLDKLAKQAAAEQGQGKTNAKSSDGQSARGASYRDPFDPAFRREAGAGAVTAGKEPASRDAKEQAPVANAKEATEVASASAATPPVPAASSSQMGPSQPPPSQPPQAAETAKAARLEADIKQIVSTYLKGAVPHIEVTVTEEGLLISITDDYNFGMFAIASAEPRPGMVVVMEKLAKVLAAQPEPLVIRGHTDGRPYKSGTYDNWRLSTARAHMAYYMLIRGGIDEKRFERVEGYADRRLRVPSDPEAAQNRRIEILLRKPKP